MTRPTVFISYSHQDEAEKEQLLSHLGVLQRAGLIEVWSDDRLGAGADWEAEISRAIAQARVAILLISVNFLNSDFILGQEVPSFLKRREGEGLVVFPVIAKACAWRSVAWLARLNVRPKNGRPIWGAADSHVDEDLAAIAEEVARIVNVDNSDLTPDPPPVMAADIPAVADPTLIQLQLPDEKYPLARKRQEILVDTLAAICDLPRHSIRVLDVKAEGLWVALTLARASAERLVELFETNAHALGPLRAQFHVSNISLLPVELPPTGLPEFGPKHIFLVRLLYLGAGKVLIERELGGGFGGAQVLLAQPTDRQGIPMARQIIKLCPGPELRGEYDNYAQRIKNYLPQSAARIDNYAEIDGLAGIVYSFIGDGMLGQPRTLAAYYQDPQASTADIIQSLTELLDEELGQRLYGKSRPHTFHLDREYGRHLVEHLRLRFRPASVDGVWPVEQAPALIAPYRHLGKDEIVPEHHDISKGTLVHCDGLTVSRVKYRELKLHHPTNPGIVVKVEFQPDDQTSRTFSPGDKVIARGEVIYNRQSRLEEIVSAAFSGYSEAAVDIQQDKLNWGSEGNEYPNPLRLYPTVLNWVINGKESLVHGDLHLRNVLVDQKGRGWLIDFARVMNRHNLYDFIKLETYIRQMILSQAQYQFSFAAYLQFEEVLASASLGHSASPPDHSDLRKAYQVIQALREVAAHYMGYPVNFHAEYFPALFLYNLAVLKYHDNHGDQAARLAFATVAVVGRALTQDAPKPAPRPQEPEPRLVPSSPEPTGQEAQPPQPDLSPEDEAFLREQLTQHEQNRRQLLKQKSVFGVGNVPLHLLNQIKAEEDEIKALKSQLGE